MPTGFEQLHGFVQCVSQPFRVKQHYNIMVKLTSKADCFCQPVYHILIRWVENQDSENTSQHRNLFLSGFRNSCWVDVEQVRRSKIYANQEREHIVWLYIPQESRVRPHNCKPPERYCLSGTGRCPSWPIGLVSSFACRIISRCARGRILELQPCDSPGATFIGLSDFPLKNFPSHILVCHNVWICLIPPNWYGATAEKYAGYVLFGIYSSLSHPALSELSVENQSNLPGSSMSWCCTTVGLTKSFAVDLFVEYHLNKLLGSTGNQMQISSAPQYLKYFLATNHPSTPQFAQEFIAFPRKFNVSSRNNFRVISLADLIQIASELPSTPAVSSSVVRMRFTDPGSRVLIHQRSGYQSNDTDGVVEWSGQVNCTTIQPPAERDDISVLVLSPHPSRSRKAVLVGRLGWDAHSGCFRFEDVDWSSGSSTERTSFPIFLDRQSTQSQHPLPQLGTAVILGNWGFINDLRCQYLVTDALTPLEFCETLPLSLESLSTLTISERVNEHLQLSCIGAPRPVRVSRPDTSYGFEIMGYSGTELKCFILTGNLAMRYYPVLRIGCVYSFVLSRHTENIFELLRLDCTDNDLSSTCSHLFSFSEMTDLVERIRYSPDRQFGQPISFQALVINRIQLEDGLYLWLVDDMWTSALIEPNCSELDLKDRVVVLHIPLPQKSFCLPIIGFPIRAFYIHVLRNSHQPLSYPLLVASSLSRIEVLWSGSKSNDIGPQSGIITTEPCSHCHEIRDSIRLSVPDLCWLSDDLGSAEQDVACIRVRALITKCLEFGCWKVPGAAAGHQNQPLSFFLRFIIHDGSASAIVQLGSRIPFNSTSVYFPINHSEELANRTSRCLQALLGLSRTLWTSLVTQLKQMVNDQTGSGIFNFSLTGFSTSESRATMVEAALRTYLSSMSFLRPHEFILHRSSQRPTSVPWRLREIRLNDASNEVVHLNLVCPPSNFYSLLYIRPFVSR